MSTPHSKHAVALASKLYIQRTIGKFCDVCICTKESRFLAHKCVLAANSPKLDTLIQEATKKNGHGQDIEIELTDLNSNGFEHLLEYFYTGSLNLNSENIMPVIMAAGKLDLGEVVSRCTDVYHLSNFVDSNAQNNDTSTKEHTPMTLLPPIPQHVQMNEVEDKDLEKKGLSQNVIMPDALTEGGKITSSSSADTIAVHDIYQQSNEQNYAAAAGHTSNSPIPLCEGDVVIDVNLDIGNSKLIPTTIPVTGTGGGGESSSFNGIGGGGDCKTMMEQVGRLREQHQRLQELQQRKQQEMLSQQQQQQTYSNYSGSGGEESQIVEPEKKKARVKTTKSNEHQHHHHQYAGASPTLIYNTTSHHMSATSSPQDTYGTSNLNLNLVPVNNNNRSVNPPTDFRIVTDEVRDALYAKYDSFKNDTPIGSTCDVSELLQRGKSRNRKTTEQNCLNTTIRLVLDTMQIVESTDPRVEDALILIMDKFETLRAHINNQEIRRSLRIKVRHSIHCKKWRIKKKQMQGTNAVNSSDDYSNMNILLKQRQDSAEDSLHG